MLSQENITWVIRASQDIFHWNIDKENAVSYLPLSHIAAQVFIFFIFLFLLRFFVFSDIIYNPFVYIELIMTKYVVHSREYSKEESFESICYSKFIKTSNSLDFDQNAYQSYCWKISKPLFLTTYMAFYFILPIYLFILFVNIHDFLILRLLTYIFVSMVDLQFGLQTKQPSRKVMYLESISKIVTLERQGKNKSEVKLPVCN